VTSSMRLAVIAALALADVAAARSLSEQLGVFQPGFVSITPQILRLQKALPRATDFPATTTTPGIAFWFDPQSGAYERRPGPLGPAFLERVDTVGRGRVEVASSYLFARFIRFDGEDLSEALSSRFVAKSGSLIVPQRVDTEDFSLTSNVLYFSATYGVRGDTDVNLLMPLYVTSMDGDRRFKLLGVPGSFESLEGNKVGPGDLLLRAKYRFLDRNTWGLAAGLALQLPTGNEENFQGLGDVLVTPTFIASWMNERFDLHGSLGVYFDASAVQRSGVRWGVGASWAARQRVTILCDVVGTSDFRNDDVTFFVPDKRLVTIQGAFDPPVSARVVGDGTEFTTPLGRRDIVDLALAMKVRLYRDLVGFVGVILPLTNDGARAAAIPTGGLQYGF
jgi:hypothetical protein